MSRGVAGTKWKDEVSEVGASVGILLGLNRGTDDETEPSIRVKGNV